MPTRLEVIMQGKRKKNKKKIKKKIKKEKLKKKITERIFNANKIPAVTKVEECTIAEIGVGADIAAGSHLEKGNCALLVKLQININNKRLIE